jgi:hypothetical protein
MSEGFVVAGCDCNQMVERGNFSFIRYVLGKKGQLCSFTGNLAGDISSKAVESELVSNSGSSEKY